MTASNGLVTVADLLAFLPNSANAVTAQVEQAIEAASLAICTYKGHFRPFYPIVQGRMYDIPYSRELALRADLLECLSLTNGDGSVLPDTEYRLEDVNSYPKTSIKINSAAAIYWMLSVTTGSENAITVNGIWGYHAYYPQAWALASTIGAGINASVTTVAVTSSTPYSAGQILRCGDELMLVTAVATNSLTVIRAWNGSTAAAHDILSTLKVWKTQPDIARACLIQAARYYRRNEAIFGTTGGGEMGVQPVAIPSLDPDVAAILEQYVMRF
jgi:hypothetical protein